VIDSAALRARLAVVRDRIARAAGRVGRDPASVRLVAVSKTFPTDLIRAAAESGQLDFGENRLQEALAKMDQTADLGLSWHLIGHLQSNKARRAAERFAVIHSVDSGTLLGKLDEAATAAGRKVELLVQVDLARESTKHGALPHEARAILAQAASYRAAAVKGLMVLPPFSANPDDARSYFAQLRRFRDELTSEGIPRSMLAELSMGMSHDLEVAVEEGATMVRVGSAIFGSRPPV
jgi:pyridoxal phosphate enzyme (YggS family)